MRDVAAELKSLRLYGMMSAWEEVAADSNSVGMQTSRWLIEHLLQAEHTDRHMRSISYQMHSARFPLHRDLAGFEFEQSKVDRSLIDDLAGMSFTEPSPASGITNDLVGVVCQPSQMASCFTQRGRTDRCASFTLRSSKNPAVNND